MAYSLVAHASQNNGSGVTGAIDTSTATLLVVQIGALNAIPIAAPTDSKSNSWTGLTNFTSASGGAGRLFYSIPTSVGSGHIFTSGGSFPSICVQAWSGAAASPFDQEATGQNGAASPADSGGSKTPSANNALIVSAWAEATTATPTINGGFTISDTAAGIGGTSYGCSMAYLVQTTAAAANPTWTWSGSPAGIDFAIFLAAAGGATRGLFRPPSGSGLGVGGSFFRDPLQAREQMVKRNHIYVPERYAA